MAGKIYHSVEAYRDAANALYAVGGIVISSFARNDCDTKNTIIRNFVARAALTTKSIFALWDLCDFQSAWVVHRALVDRMFHLHHIGENDEFSEFDDWSFFEQYKAQNRLKSDSDFSDQAIGWMYDLTVDQKKRIQQLEKEKPEWRRPKARDVAKDMGMDFLYKFGYDYASTHVHPMANDGQEDFYTITKLKPSPQFPSNISVISNTILTTSMIIQDALNHSSFLWAGAVWDFLAEVRRFLESGDASYQLPFLKTSALFEGNSLCKPT